MTVLLSDDAPHLLVVDDDTRIRDLLSRYLSEQGFRVTVAGDAAEARRKLDGLKYDLIILDVMMPGESGLSLTQSLYQNRTTPVILLTAKAEAESRIAGLEAGADDYLSKPFSPRELVGRIKAILRRTAHMPRDPVQSAVSVYRFGDWKLEVTARSLTHTDGSQHALSGAEFRLLAILLAHPTKVLSRSQLMELLRGRDIDPFDRSVDVRISRLRQVLRDDARSPKIIKTVYGEGYVMGVPVEQE